MGITNVDEMPRSVTHLLGSSPEYVRTFVVTEEPPLEAAATVLLACGVAHGSSHPEFSKAKCYSVEVSESTDEGEFKVNVVAKYKIPEVDDPDLLPWQRPDVWRFQTQGVAVPALYYWDGTTQKPMVNSAGDYIEGVTVDEAQQKVTIESNRQTFPSALAAAVTNCVNDGSYLGFAADCVKVQGIRGEPATEMINNAEVRYWKITSELLCRQTGWNLLIPDVGFNFVQGGNRRRAYVIGPPPEDAQVASSNPVALNGSGAMQPAGTLPAILTRRVYRRITMSTYFGSPPT